MDLRVRYYKRCDWLSEDDDQICSLRHREPFPYFIDFSVCSELVLGCDQEPNTPTIKVVGF